MIQTVEAVVDANGQVSPRRALVTILDEPAFMPGEAAMLAEEALAVDWSRPEEDAAWSYVW